MADLLGQARRNREYPPSKFPYPDAASVVEDWNKLNSLREARGDPALAAPEKYLKLRVSLAREIRERDDMLEGARDQERSRKLVQSALALAQDRGQLAGTVQDTVHGAPCRNGNVMDSHEMEEVSEKILTLIEESMLDTSIQVHSDIAHMDDKIDALIAKVDVMSTAFRSQATAPTQTTTQSQPAARPMGHSTAMLQLPPHSYVSERPLPELKRTFNHPLSEAGALGDKAPLVTRSRRPRGHRPHRPQQLRDYMGRMFAKKED